MGPRPMGGPDKPKEAGLVGIEPDRPRMSGPNGLRAGGLDKPNN